MAQDATSQDALERTAGIVLAGGRSRRMGSPKAALEWHGSTLLRRAAGIVARAVDGPVVVVRAPGQELPPLPAGVELADDARAGHGPLQGIAAGIALVADRAGVVYVTGVDAPLLHPAFVRHVLRSLGADDDVALPRVHGFAQPLAAAYRTSIAAILEEQIAHERLDTGALLARLRVRELDRAALLADACVAAFDPALDSLLNVNEPGDYEAARRRPAPAVTVHPATGGDALRVRAATLAAATAAAGVALDAHVVATLRDHGAVADPQEPLVAGDELTLRRGP
ncbi:MAG: molybdenum cofactor guanylyltransferase [Solirubrobacteraceae bacterium]|nr:molybdenum cofactor guanylyltransferase [Solirubrobacteraceae bacterium]